MRVFISGITVKKSRYDSSHYYELVGQLQSGLEIYINNYHYDLERYIGYQVEMLLCVMRSPYLERGMKDRLFLSGEFYSVELIDELIKEKGFRLGDNRKELIICGEFIDTYNIPEKWNPLITSSFFRSLLKKPSAIKTEDGIFLLNPIHLKKRIPIENFPRKVTIATGCIDLAAWTSL